MLPVNIGYFAMAQVIAKFKSEQWLSHFTVKQNHMEGLLKQRLPGLIPRVSDGADTAGPTTENC